MKTKHLLLLTFLFFCYMPGYSQDLPFELKGYWALDEGEGEEIIDGSESGNNGILTNGVVWVEEGKFGAALEFDGIDDFVNLGNNPSLEVGPNDFSISAWINTTGGTGSDMSVYAKGGDNGGGVRYHLAVVGNNVKIIVDDDITKKDPGGSIPVVDSVWHHVVAFREGLNLRVYIDGIEDEGITNHSRSTLVEGYDISNTVHASYLGCITNNDDLTGATLFKYFKGKMDDIALWSRALTVDEIAYLWNYGDGNTVLEKSTVNIQNIETIGQFTSFSNSSNTTNGFRFYLKENSLAKLNVYNSLGQEVAELLNDNKTHGVHTVQLDDNGLTSGIYFARLQAGNNFKTLKFIVNK